MYMTEGEQRIRENYRVNTAVSFSGTISIVFNQRLHKLQRRESMSQFPCTEVTDEAQSCHLSLQAISIIPYAHPGTIPKPYFTSP